MNSTTQIHKRKVSQQRERTNSKDEQTAAFVTGGSGYLGRNLIKYLVSKGWKVIAIARSNKSMKTVENAGAVGILGDLDSIKEMTDAMIKYNCKYCFHCAGSIKFWAVYEDSLHINRDGTINVAKACKNANILRLIHVSTNSVLTREDIAMIKADESWDYPKKTFGVYGITKRFAEIEVLKYNNIKNKYGNIMTVMSIRPPFIWGNDDTSLLKIIVELINNGSFAWFDGGIHKISIAHVLNVCHAMYLMSIFNENEKDIGGEIYFIKDEMDVQMKPFVRDMLKCVVNSKKSMYKTNKIKDINNLKIRTFKYNYIYMLAYCLETLLCCSLSKNLNDCLDGLCNCCCSCLCKCDKHWFCEMVQPPITRFELCEGGRECTVVDDKIRKELNFKQIFTIKEGLIELARLNGKTEKEIEQINWESI